MNSSIKNDASFNALSLKDALTACDVEMNMHEWDGMICGWVCANNPKVCFNDVLKEHLGNAVNGVVENHFDQRKLLFSDIDEAFTFQPLLPELDEGVCACIAALKAWCRGWMHGVGLHISQTALEDNAQSQELLLDVAKITKIDERSLEDNEQNQSDYLELLEYIRLAVWTMDQEIRVQVFENPNKATHSTPPVDN